MTQKLAILSLFLFLLSTSIIGCQPNPIAESYAQNVAFRDVLRDQVNADPEVLLDKLEQFVTSTREQRAEMRRRCAAMPVEKRERAQNVYHEKISRCQLEITALDAQIRDQLRDDPVHLSRYTMLINQIR